MTEGFEVASSANGTFGLSLVLTPGNGTLTDSEVFVRMAAPTVVGVISGNLTVSSNGAETQTVELSGESTIDPEQVVGTFIGNYQSGNLTSLPAVELAARGQLVVTMGKEAAFSGSILVEAKKTSFKGAFSDNGTATINLAAPSKVPVVIALELGSGEEGATLINAVVVVGNSPNLPAICLPTAYTGKKGDPVFPLDKKQINNLLFALGNSGNYTLGDSFATAKGGKDGTFKFAGTMPDNTKIAGSARVVRNGPAPGILQIPVCFPVSGVKGLVIGETIYSNETPVMVDDANIASAEVDGSVDPLLYIRPGNAKAKAYVDGFIAEFQILGQLWAPVKGSSLIGTGLTDVALEIDEEILGGENGLFESIWPVDNKPDWTDPLDQPAPKGFKFTATATSGAIKGAAPTAPVNGQAGKPASYIGLMVTPGFTPDGAAGILRGGGFVNGGTQSGSTDLIELP